MHAKTDMFFTRVYSGVLPAYPHDDFDIWIDKPGHIDLGTNYGGINVPDSPPLTQYRVAGIFAQDSSKDFEFFADTGDEIVFVMTLSYYIPPTKIGWDY